jgi:hypothetical protein
MVPQRQASAATGGERILPSTAPKMEEVELGGSSGWGINHLKLLGVDFYAKRDLDLNRILKVKEAEWSQELKERNKPL